MPTLVTATEENTKEYDCEVGFFVEEIKFIDLNTIEVKDTKFTDLNTFESQFKSKIKKEARRCDCDTLFIDINNIFKMEDSSTLWGVCTSKKKFKEK